MMESDVLVRIVGMCTEKCSGLQNLLTKKKDFVAVQRSAVQNTSNGKHLSSNKWLKNIDEIPYLQNQRESTPRLNKIISVLLARKQNEANKAYIRGGDSMNDFMYKLNTFIKKHTKNNNPGKRDPCSGFGKFGSHIYRSCKKSLFKGPSLVFPDADFRRNQYQQHMFVERARSDSSSESDRSSEDRGRSKSSRFKIIDNGEKQKVSSETESEPTYSNEDSFKEESDDSDYTYKKKSPKKKTKNVKAPSESEEDEMDNQFMYLQGSRLHSPRRTRRDDTRDRLPHFLPKKYHWFPEAIHKLDSFWLNGDMSKKDLYFEYW